MCPSHRNVHILIMSICSYYVIFTVMRDKIKDITGKKFHLLTAISFHSCNKKQNAKWLFRCDCGNEKLLSSGNVTRKKEPTKSCGCLLKDNFKGFQAFQNAVFVGSHYNDADLTLNEFIELSQKDCYWCGRSVEEVGNNTKSRCKKYQWKWNGLDRSDNSRLHFKNNVVTCCSSCNTLKSKRNHDQFKSYIEKIYLNMQNK